VPKGWEAGKCVGKKADKALYYSKANCKNQVTAYQDINSALKKR
jgi:hypothetical protein